MKTIILILAVTFAAVYSSGQKAFSLTGVLKGENSGTLYLSYPGADGKGMKDSAVINPSGQFFFKGVIVHPVSAMLTLHRNAVSVDDPDFTSFFISPGNMMVTLQKGKFKELRVEGSPAQQEQEEMHHSVAGIEKSMKPFLAAYREEKDQDKAAVIRESIDSLREIEKVLIYQFFEQHPASWVTAYMLQFYYYELSVGKMEGYYAGFTDEIRGSKYGKQLKEEIDKLKASSPGAIAGDFSATGMDGKRITLSSFRQQKYVLLDFWASWCIPCRKGNPHLKELYAKYREKGFEIIGVSDDDSRPENWKKAVKEDALPWIHVLRGLDWEKIRKGEKNPDDISEKFGIHSLPTKILVDKNGMIIGRYNEEQDDELDRKLEEIFN